MSENININVKKLQIQQEELRRTAERVNRIAGDDLYGIIHILKQYWSGGQSAAYIEKLRRLQRMVETTGKDISETSRVLQDVIDRTKAAEAENRAILMDNH